MESSKQGKQNNKEAERLARRNERAQRQRLEETVEERETRLAKHREAWRKKTAEAKGKQKEYQKVSRQQKKAAEPEGTEVTADEGVNRLDKVKKNEHQRVYMQRKKAAESTEERETHLENRREAWRQRTKGAKDRGNEYQRVHRQQKKSAESTEEKETRLAKRREARREKFAESNGKQNESNIVYNAVDKMQNETMYNM